MTRIERDQLALAAMAVRIAEEFPNSKTGKEAHWLIQRLGEKLMVLEHEQKRVPVDLEA